MDRPIIKQFRALRASDFERNAVWVNCHVIDYGEQWYDETDEESFRPWLEELPVSPSTVFLVSATFTFADGSQWRGFVTPTAHGMEFPNALGQMQPNVFGPGGEPLGFWLGRAKQSISVNRERLRSVDDLFPIRFQALPGLTSGLASGIIPGFCWRSDARSMEVRVDPG